MTELTRDVLADLADLAEQADLVDPFTGEDLITADLITDALIRALIELRHADNSEGPPGRDPGDLHSH